MFVPGDNDVINEQEPRTGEPQTDRVNGEYHYKNGYTQKIYSDAHYVREEDDTAPPRYYTPPERPAKEQKAVRLPNAGGAAKTICLCLICAILGGLGGAALMGARMTGRLDALESSVSSLQESEAEYSQGSALAALEEGEVDASDIYALACNQVVCITIDTNYDGSANVSGTGFFISSDGYIITNYHVIDSAYKDNLEILISLHDGRSYDANIVGVEEGNDIAVLKIDADNVQAANIGDSSSISVGDVVYAVGNPLGELDYTMSAGHISALDRVVKTEESSESISMFQIDAAVNSGNSGGPVYNSRGEVIGVVTAKYSDTGVEGIGFAIPVNDANSIANDLITEGYVTGKAYMGARFDERYNSMYSQYYGLPLGAYVYSVESGSSAEKAGLQAGDIITRLGGQVIDGYDALRSAVRSYSAGDTTELVIYRAGENLTVKITFDELLPEASTASPTKLQPTG